MPFRVMRNGFFALDLFTSVFELDFASLGRIAPDPVAFVPVGIAILRQSDSAAVVCFIPPDRVEDKLAVVRAAVFERLAVDDVARQLLDKLRCERIERFRELAVRQPESLHRAGAASKLPLASARPNSPSAATRRSSP